MLVGILRVPLVGKSRMAWGIILPYEATRKKSKVLLVIFWFSDSDKFFNDVGWIKSILFSWAQILVSGGVMISFLPLGRSGTVTTRLGKSPCSLRVSRTAIENSSVPKKAQVIIRSLYQNWSFWPPTNFSPRLNLVEDFVSKLRILISFKIKGIILVWN